MTFRFDIFMSNGDINVVLLFGGMYRVYETSYPSVIGKQISFMIKSSHRVKRKKRNDIRK